MHAALGRFACMWYAQARSRSALWPKPADAVSIRAEYVIASDHRRLDDRAEARAVVEAAVHERLTVSRDCSMICAPPQGSE